MLLAMNNRVRIGVAVYQLLSHRFFGSLIKILLNILFMYEFTQAQFCEQDMDEASMSIIFAIFSFEKQKG